MSDIKEKVKLVIASCSTEDQLLNAIKYAQIALKRAKSWEKMDWLICFEKHIGVVQFKLGLANPILYKVSI